MATKIFRNKNLVRPKKKGGPKRRRLFEQKRRLAALGVPEETIRHLTSVEVRDLVTEPTTTAKRFAKAKAKAQA